MRVTPKMKDGRANLAHKAEHGVDMDSGAVFILFYLLTVH
jgi:hypothetical protein